ADARFVDILLEIGADVLPRVFKPPSDGCIIVVRAGVDHKIWCVVVRNVVGSRHVLTKGKLKHFHAGQTKFITKGKNRRINISEIFGNERKPAELLPKNTKNVSPGTLEPLSLFCGLGICRYFPV